MICEVNPSHDVVWVSTKGIGSREGYYLCIQCDSLVITDDIKKELKLE